MKHIIIFLSFLHGLTCMAQGNATVENQWEKSWDSTYQLGVSETMHDLLYLTDGRIAVVGVSVGEKGEKRGFFLLLNSLNGQRITYKSYETIRDNALTGVAYAGDETFYLVGYQETQNEKQQAWLLRVEADGAIMHAETRGSEGDDRFEKIEWLGHNGIIVGHSDKFVDNEMWVFKVDDNRLEEVRPVGDGMVDKIIGTEKGKNTAWICAYASKSKGMTRKGDIVAFQLDANGMFKGQAVIQGKSGQQIHSMSVTERGELLIGGAAWGTSVGSDSWWAKVSPTGNTEEYPALSIDGNDYASAIQKTPGGKKLLVVKWPKSKRLSVVELYDNDEKPNLDDQVYYLPMDNFEVQKLIYLKKNTYLMAGTNLSRDNRNNAIRLMCMQDTERLPKSRGVPQLEYTDLMFDDESHDGYLSAGERATIRIKVSNSEKSEAPVQEGTLKIVVINPVPGVYIQQTVHNLGFMPAGEGTDFTFSVKAEKNIKIPKINIEIIAEIGGQPYLRVPYSFEGVPEKAAPVFAQNIIITDPDPSQSGSRVVVAQKKEQVIKAKGFSQNGEIKSNDFQKVNNGKILKDERALTKIDKVQKTNRFEYNLEYTLQLDPGRNEFYITFENGTSDTLIIDYTPEKPNLYVLSIGVPGHGLVFPPKDARDFALTLNSPENREYFNRIELDTLCLETNTRKREILKAFQRMQIKAKNIKPDDYVMIFVAGHGLIRADDNALGLVPSDFDHTLPNSETTVNLEEMIRGYINPLKCKKFVFMDACHSGSGVDGSRETPNDPNLPRRQREASLITTGAAVFASCDSTELSYEDERWQNGAFTKALIEAFSGQNVILQNGSSLSADMGHNPLDPKDERRKDGFISVQELHQFLRVRVPDLVRSKVSNKSQTPVMEMKEPMKDYVTIFHYKKQ